VSAHLDVDTYAAEFSNESIIKIRFRHICPGINGNAIGRSRVSSPSNWDRSALTVRMA